MAKVFELQLQHQSFQWIFQIDFLCDWLIWSPWVQGTLNSFSNITVQKHQFVSAQPSSQSNSLNHTWPMEKTTALPRWTFVGKVMSLLFNMLSRLVITFLPRSKHLLISWLQSLSAVILNPQKIKSDTVSTVSPSISYELMGPDTMILVFWMLSFEPTFSLSSFTFIKRLFSSSYFLPQGWCYLHIWHDWYFSRQSWFQLVLLPAQRFSWCTLHIS